MLDTHVWCVCVCVCVCMCVCVCVLVTWICWALVDTPRQTPESILVSQGAGTGTGAPGRPLSQWTRRATGAPPLGPDAHTAAGPAAAGQTLSVPSPTPCPLGRGPLPLPEWCLKAEPACRACQGNAASLAEHEFQESTSDSFRVSTSKVKDFPDGSAG